MAPTGTVVDYNHTRNDSEKDEAATQPKPTTLASPTEGFEEVLSQMFPGMDKEYLRNMLGPSPSLEEVQRFAEEMASGSYPKDESLSENGTEATSSNSLQGDQDDASASSLKKGASGLRKKFGRAFSGLRPSSIGGLPHSGSNSKPPKAPPAAIGGSTIAGPGGGSLQESQKPVPTVADAQSHDNLGHLLQSAIKSSSQVNKSGIHSHNQELTSIPEGLDRGETCEMIPGHSLKPFPGPRGTGMTTNGIRIFSAREIPASEAFLLQNDLVIETFAVVLEHLCGVYGLPRTSLAMFHDPNGGTIAFNAGKALHCNIRFFYALFFSKGLHTSSDCYSYWFVTFAHELAHHLVSAHNREHGFYTESYVTKYLPKFVALLASLEATRQV